MTKIERVTQRVVKPAAAAAAAAAAEEDEGKRGGSREWVALSSADFFGPPAHVELLLAFEAAPPIPALEDGLRKALSHYRELAGRILVAHPQAGRPAIQLNDAGAAFIEAQADGPLHLMLPFDPTPLTRDLLPPHAGAPELLLVQVTTFTCGGIIMGIAWHHQVADAEAGIDFMNAWACVVRGQSMPFSSSQDRSILMARDPPQPVYDHMDIQTPIFSIKETSIPQEMQEVAVRRLHFSGDLLGRIKEEAKKEGEEFTRFESLMGHLWRCITRARGLEEEVLEETREGEGKDVGGETRLNVAVNARRRMEPKIESGYFGNVICPVGASANVKRLMREPLGYAARLVKEAIKKVGEGYVRSSLDYIEIKQPFASGGTRRRTGGTLSATPNLSVTSWATMPIYHLDFGTGYPLFAGNAYIPLEGLLSILPPPLSFDDRGLNVVVGLFAPAMDKLLSIYDTII